MTWCLLAAMAAMDSGIMSLDGLWRERRIPDVLPVTFRKSRFPPGPVPLPTFDVMAREGLAR